MADAQNINLRLQIQEITEFFDLGDFLAKVIDVV
jgi:hypothetical protein